MKQILVEGFDYLDLLNQIEPKVTVDEYAAKMGSNDDVVTLAFTVKGHQVGDDLSDWFERGYNFILDSQVSEGEIRPGKYLVFVEMDRRSTVPERIVQILDDLETLTDLPLEDWKVIIDDEEYEPTEEIIKSKMILSPHRYREVFGDEDENEEKIDEMKNLSGINPKKKFKDPDTELKNYIAKAGL